MEPFYDGLGLYSRKVTTKSSEAQRYFYQSLGFLYGFDHGAAIRAFQQAARTGIRLQLRRCSREILSKDYSFA